MDADSIRGAATAPPDSPFPSKVQLSLVSQLNKAGSDASKTFTISDLHSSGLADPRVRGFARRFCSLARRRRTPSVTITPQDLLGVRISTGAREDSTGDEVMGDSKAVGLAADVVVCLMRPTMGRRCVASGPAHSPVGFSLSFFFADASTSNAAPGSSVLSRSHSPAPMTRARQMVPLAPHTYRPTHKRAWQ